MELIPNIFTSYKLTQLEEITGTILTHTQVAVLSNKLANIATSKLALRFNPINPLEFAQAEAYERGQMDVIQWLLDSSVAAQESVTTGDSSNSRSSNNSEV